MGRQVIGAGEIHELIDFGFPYEPDSGHENIVLNPKHASSWDLSN